MTVLESSSLIASSNVRSWKTGTSASTSRAPARTAAARSAGRGARTTSAMARDGFCVSGRYVRVGQQLDIGIGRVAGNADDANPLVPRSGTAIGARRAPRRSTKYFCAAVVMIATGSVSLRSPFVKARPARQGADGSEEVGADDEAPCPGPIGVVRRRPAAHDEGLAGADRERRKRARRGRGLDPECALESCGSASCRRATALSSRCFHSGVTICAVSRGCGSKPMSTRLIAIIDRTTSVATTRASSPMRPARQRARDGCAARDRARGAPTLLERLAGLIV